MSNITLFSVQAARGLAAFLVVAFHMLSIEEKYVGLKTLPSVFSFGQIGVDIFFVISGFVMVLSTERMIAGRRTILEFLKRRLLRIYPIYWFFALLLLPIYLIAPQLVNASEGNRVDLMRSFLLLPHDNLPLLAVAWSLIFEIWFYLVFAAFLTMRRKHLPALLALWCAILLALGWLAPDISSPTLKVMTSPYAYEFIAGCAGYFFYRRASPRWAKSAIFTGVMGMLICLGTWPNIAETASIQRAVWLGLTASAVLAGIAALERNGKFRLLARLKWTGDISYVVYLSHILVLSAGGRIWKWVVDGLELSLLLVSGFWLMATMAVIAAGLFTHHVIEAPLSRLLNRRSYKSDASSHKASISSGDIAIAEPIKSNN